MGENMAEYIMKCAKATWGDYKAAQTEQERQQAADTGAALEHMAVEFYGEAFADKLPWNKERVGA